jgi:hypothetical protein
MKNAFSAFMAIPFFLLHIHNIPYFEEFYGCSSSVAVESVYKGTMEGYYVHKCVDHYIRHRQSLIESGADCIKKMQKSMRMMNIRLAIAISDVTGQSGKAIVQAIIAGKTDAKYLAGLANYKIQKSKEELAHALTGIRKAELCHGVKAQF